MSGQIFEKIQSYIDANYVSEAGADEYNWPKSGYSSDALTEDEKLRLVTLEKLNSHGQVRQLQEANRNAKSNVAPAFQLNDLDLPGENTFQEQLFFYIDRSGMKPSAIYRPIEMSRQQYSRIQCNKHYQPKKTTAMLLTIILRLSVIEAEDLLSRAGYAFNPSSKQDLIVKACLANGQYDLFVIDAMMQKNNLDTLIDYEGKRA